MDKLPAEATLAGEKVDFQADPDLLKPVDTLEEKWKLLPSFLKVCETMERSVEGWPPQLAGLSIGVDRLDLALVALPPGARHHEHVLQCTSTRTCVLR